MSVGVPLVLHEEDLVSAEVLAQIKSVTAENFLDLQPRLRKSLCVKFNLWINGIFT